MWPWGKSNDQSRLERETELGLRMLGRPEVDARREAKEIVAAGVSEMKANRVEEPGPQGRRVLECERTGGLSEKMAQHLKIVRAEGATDADIEYFYNLTVLERLVNDRLNDATRLAMFMAYLDSSGAGRPLEDEKTKEWAASRVRKTLACFGTPGTPEFLPVEDRELPPELQRRVSAWATRRPAGDADIAAGFSSLNAYIRHLIAKGAL